ncbi:MAG: CDP-diacylglycerol--glycerol-3-phosphate 3-phosphatidyltransferase [Alphaproteobacteria bacterium TMED62]|nr:MAG: CDP-diacylglycerol--glycerol-3-phosphate 3-phosphatidyltransferase [Alphaproteobacteria bacterium TMED62]|tara:strand:+ start:2015 stop:2569 length:555 start_codon:yes stop_codon:yes gene_type:complete
MNIPNFLTVLRLFFPLFLCLICSLKLNFSSEKLLILFLFIFLSLTDYFDGFLARKLKQETIFGKIFDPISDKVLSSGTLIYILTFEDMILVPALLIITREFIVSGIREYMLETKGKNIGVFFLSKIKTTMQFVSIILFLSQDYLIKYVNIFYIAYISLWIATILTIYTGLKYSYITYISNHKRK